MQNNNNVIRPFNEVSETEILEAWYVSNSASEVKRRLNVTNFGSKNKRMKEIITRYKLPSFHLKKVEDLLISDFENAFKDTSVTTLKELCVKLGIAKKMHNTTLKARIKAEKIEVPKALYKSVFGVSSIPWTYPRKHFIKQNIEIPTTCPKCEFEAIIPQQIQIHHLKKPLILNKSDFPFEEHPASSPSEAKGLLPLPFGEKDSKRDELSTINLKEGRTKRGLKKQSGYNTSKNITTICANCHSLEHHNRGPVEKEACGLWLTKKTTNRAYANPMDIFVKDCPKNYTLQKKYFIRTILKTPSEYVCKKCGASEWRGKQLVLQLHHKDSNQTNAKITNLLLLCPNCHAGCHGVIL